jgi:galactonate dehydratase
MLAVQAAGHAPLAAELEPEDLAAECETALDAGYTAMKTKARPWFDVWAQSEAVAEVTPDDFSLDFDFNDTLLDAERGIPILKELAEHPQIDIYETPIPQEDLAGNRAIRKAVDVPLAMHYGSPEPRVALKREICDGFVVSGGASEVMRAGAVCAMADKPFWLQLVGAGITAAWSLHFGGVHSHATWPAVNCHQLYEHNLLAEPIRVEAGHASVPDRPGLGHTIDTEALERFRTERPDERPEPPRLLETRYPDGRVLYLANTGEVDFMLNYARRGAIPYFQKGVTTRILPNDGSDRWQRLYEEARRRPVPRP